VGDSIATIGDPLSPIRTHKLFAHQFEFPTQANVLQCCKFFAYLFDDKYLFSILPNQQRARSDFRLILYGSTMVVWESTSCGSQRDISLVANTINVRLSNSVYDSEKKNSVHPDNTLVQVAIWKKKNLFLRDAESLCPLLIRPLTPSPPRALSILCSFQHSPYLFDFRRINMYFLFCHTNSVRDLIFV
jgi:hypothetical protein